MIIVICPILCFLIIGFIIARIGFIRLILIGFAIMIVLAFFGSY